VTGGASVSAPGRSLGVSALRGQSMALVWIKNSAHQYFVPAPDLTPVQGAVLSLQGLADGAWTARWIDAYTGADLATGPVAVSGGAVTIPVPTFARDVALRLERSP
jgi:hypothetical protein